MQKIYSITLHNTVDDSGESILIFGDEIPAEEFKDLYNNALKAFEESGGQLNDRETDLEQIAQHIVDNSQLVFASPYLEVYMEDEFDHVNAVDGNLLYHSEDEQEVDGEIIDSISKLYHSEKSE